MSSTARRKVIRSLLFAAGMLGSIFSPAQSHVNSDIEIREVAKGVWMHTSLYTYPDGTQFPSNGLIVKEGGALTLIDTAWGELKTTRLLEVISAEIQLPVSKAIVTHFHSDRAAGVDVLESLGVEVYAHPLTQRLTIEYGLPVPDRVFEDLSNSGDSIGMGRLEVIYPGPAHAMDNLMVWLPDERILFGGCAIRASESKSAGNTAHGDIESWLQAMSYIAEHYKSARVVVPGHGEPGGQELIQHTFRLVREASQ